MSRGYKSERHLALSQQWPSEDDSPPVGLCPGLNAERSRHGSWRCSACMKMQRAGSWQVMVPDSVLPGDPGWSVTDAAKANRYNGTFSGWCVKCAPKEPWPACSKCDGDGGNCACPQACMKPDRFDAEGRRELRWFVGGILCAVLALLGVLAWMSPLWSHT